jgi:hypothetical protein
LGPVPRPVQPFGHAGLALAGRPLRGVSKPPA